MTLNRLLPAVVLAVAIAALAACSTNLLEGKKIDYKSAGKLPPLEVPPDLTAPGQDDRYAVPDPQSPGSTTFSEYSRDRETAPKAGSTVVLPTPDKVRVERAGTQRWLVVKASPEELWPAVKSFWQETGFILNVERPDAGVMETDWAENRANIPQEGIRKLLGKVMDNMYSTPERDKFRTRIERGAQPGTSEVYISHRGMYEIYVSEGKSQTKWQPRPADVELEAEMLRRLMARLGADEQRAQAEVAQRAAARAKLSRGSAGPAELTVIDGFDRAWRRVGLALDRIGFTVEDRDRSKGLYFVRYVEPNPEKTEKTGFLSKLWPFGGGDKAQTGAQYRILLANAGDNTRVRVQNQTGGAEKTAASDKILALLYDQLK